MRIVAIIPARYKSSRFPGKPLMDICGRPMIWWVYQNCKKVKEFSEVYVATDDIRIRETCEKYGINVAMTSEDNPTGTDRIGEASSKIDADLIVNVQGDEPLMEPSVMVEAIRPFEHNQNLQIVNLMTKIKDPVEVVNFTIPKVITNKDGIGIYLTRSPSPYPKGSIDYVYYKQVCIYAFKPEALKFFCDYGKKFGKARVEAIEDIEILRFIENGYKVQYVDVDSETVAVDTPKDLEKVRKIFESKIARGEIEAPE